MEEKPKWTLLFNVIGTALAMASMVMTFAFRNDDAMVKLEQRLCRLEALNNMGDCKR